MIDFTNSRQVHRDAMKLAQDAFVAKQHGDETRALFLYAEAFELERQAALQFLNEEDREPTRSVLFRSAASMALNCQKFRAAEKMVALGLAGNPPDEIADELRNIYEDINFYRHLELRDTELEDDGFLLSLAGNDVGYGYINAKEFWNRFKMVEQLTYRTAERKLQVAYKADEKTMAILKNKYELYLSRPKAASFAVAIKFGKPTNQPEMFDNDFPQTVIAEFMECVDLVNRQQYETLKNRIGDDSYFQNFVSLTKGFAPDGEKIKQVGFTILRNGEQKSVALQRKKEDITMDIEEIDSLNQAKENQSEEDSYSTIQGVLKIANAKRNIINIESINMPFKDNIKVPDGLSDIVKMYFNETVKVKIIKRGKKTYRLIEIDKI